MVERAIRLDDERIDTEELVPLLRGLMGRYSLEQQKRYAMHFSPVYLLPL